MSDAPQPPQLLLSVFVFTHVPPQSVCPAGQAQPAGWQVLPPLQVNAEPHPPQFGSFVGSTQVPLQSSVVGAGHVTPQLFELHVALPPVGAGHVWHALPAVPLPH